jgi:DNA-binding transcriptional regulator GbsR (MarR family)
MIDCFESERVRVMDTDTEGQHEELVSFAEEIGLFYEDLGLPRAWGRVLGWLLVCEPDYQSAEDLAAALQASRGSISMATRALIRWGTVERQTKRGDRRTYYRIRPQSWTAVFELQAQNTTKLRDLAKHGLGLLNDEPATRRDRLQELHDFTTFYERESLALIERWHRDRGREL